MIVDVDRALLSPALRTVGFEMRLLTSTRSFALLITSLSRTLVTLLPLVMVLMSYLPSSAIVTISSSKMAKRSFIASSYINLKP